MDRTLHRPDSDAFTLSYSRAPSEDFDTTRNPSRERTRPSTAKIRAFERRLADLIGKPTDLLPFVCDGSPLTCQVLFVGTYPDSTLSSDFWQFWETGKGFTKSAWIEAYKRERKLLPLEHGRLRRNSVGNTRRVLDWIQNDIAPMHCLETYLFSAPPESAADLWSQARVTSPFDFLLENVQPKVIIAHGVEAARHLESMSLTAKVIAVPHFSRGWSRAAASELAQRIKAAPKTSQSLTFPNQIARSTDIRSTNISTGDTTMDTPYTPFMRELESRFRKATGLSDRSQYKIFYGQVRPAPILLLGDNPGDAPTNINRVSRTRRTDAFGASSSFFENDEHDILDCDWLENFGLQSLLAPLVGGNTQSIRQQVVQTNMAFFRVTERNGVESARARTQSAPFLEEIVGVVKPEIIILSGVSIEDFNEQFASASSVIVSEERDARLDQTVFAASRSKLRVTGSDVLVVQLADASQYGWTYARYEVAKRIAAIAN